MVYETMNFMQKNKLRHTTLVTSSKQLGEMQKCRMFKSVSPHAVDALKGLPGQSLRKDTKWIQIKIMLIVCPSFEVSKPSKNVFVISLE